MPITHAFGINKNTDGTIDFKLVNRNEAKDYLSYNKRDGVAESGDVEPGDATVLFVVRGRLVARARSVRAVGGESGAVF